MSARRNHKYWLSPHVGYPAANERNVKMLTDALREVYLHQEPLTLPELRDLYENLEDKTILNICRAIEEAHGIKKPDDVISRDNPMYRYEINEEDRP